MAQTQTPIEDNLFAAFQAMNNDKSLAKKFVDNPTEVLKSLNVDTTGLSIKTSDVDTAKPMVTTGESPAPVTPQEEGWTVCGSVGVVACVSAGKLL